MKRSDRGFPAALTDAVLDIGSTTSVWIARDTADPAEEYSGRGFSGAARVADSESRRLTEAESALELRLAEVERRGR